MLCWLAPNHAPESKKPKHSHPSLHHPAYHTLGIGANSQLATRHLVMMRRSSEANQRDTHPFVWADGKRIVTLRMAGFRAFPCLLGLLGANYPLVVQVPTRPQYNTIGKAGTDRQKGEGDNAHGFCVGKANEKVMPRGVT